MADGETNTADYWINWRFALCFLWILSVIIGALLIIWKYEGSKKSESSEGTEEELKKPGVVHEDAAWNTCLRRLHPGWLLAFRLFSFVYMLSIIIGDGFSTGLGVFFFYTEWSFSLITFYFLLGTMFSLYGLWECRNRVGDAGDDDQEVDSEKGACGEAHKLEKTPDMSKMSNKSFNYKQELQTRRIANRWGYVLQIMFQMGGGAVVLTDLVFWTILKPFVQSDDEDLKYIIVNLHSVNAVLLIGDAAMNNMGFPLFRVAYFILWTCTFVIFQWISHSIVSLWWPYPFLSLEPPTAPLWYFGIGLMHIPCYGIFVLLVKLKHFCYSKYFPDSYRCLT